MKYLSRAVFLLVVSVFICCTVHPLALWVVQASSSSPSRPTAASARPRWHAVGIRLIRTALYKGRIFPAGAFRGLL